MLQIAAALLVAHGALTLLACIAHRQRALPRPGAARPRRPRASEPLAATDGFTLILAQPLPAAVALLLVLLTSSTPPASTSSAERRAAAGASRRTRRTGRASPHSSASSTAASSSGSTSSPRSSRRSSSRASSSAFGLRGVIFRCRSSRSASTAHRRRRPLRHGALAEDGRERDRLLGHEHRPAPCSGCPRPARRNISAKQAEDTFFVRIGDVPRHGARRRRGAAVAPPPGRPRRRQRRARGSVGPRRLARRPQARRPLAGADRARAHPDAGTDTDADAGTDTAPLSRRRLTNRRILLHCSIVPAS